jgi:hypothetical protein
MTEQGSAVLDDGPFFLAWIPAVLTVAGVAYLYQLFIGPAETITLPLFGVFIISVYAYSGLISYFMWGQPVPPIRQSERDKHD